MNGLNLHTGNRKASLKLGETAAKCARCGKTVYFAEQVFGAGKKWHKQCFKCVACNKTVNSTTMRDKDGKENNHLYMYTIMIQVSWCRPAPISPRSNTAETFVLSDIKLAFF